MMSAEHINNQFLDAVRIARAEAARLDEEKRAEERRRLGIEGYRVEWGKDAPTGCTPMRITTPDGQVSSGIVCFGRGHARRTRCQSCSEGWSVAQCDFPLAGPGTCKSCKGKGRRGGGKCHACDGTTYQMCNQHICKRCCAHLEPDEDYCPAHRIEAGFAPLIKRESCRWTSSPNLVRRDCLHKECSTMIEHGQRVLFFPHRSRAMCEPCGEAYMAVAQ